MELSNLKSIILKYKLILIAVMLLPVLATATKYFDDVIASTYTSNSTNPSSSGVLRLARTDTIGWRNAANGGNLLLSVDASDRLLYNGNILSNLTASDFVDNGFNIVDNGDATKKIAFQASGITTATTRTLTVPDASGTLLLSGAVVNADINAGAAIAISKLATVTASRALVSDGSGVISPAATTATEIGYVNGVTSALCGINQTCTFTNKILQADDGSSGSPSISFDADTDTGLYRNTTDTLDIQAGGFTGLQIKKSTGNFANVGMGTSASTSDQVLLSMSRSNTSAGTYAVASNTSTSANAFGGWRVEGDNGNVVGQIAAYTAASTIDAYISAMVVRASGSATKLSLAGPMIKFYTNNATLTTAEEALRLNADLTMQFPNPLASSPAAPASGLKFYPKTDGKFYKMNTGGSEVEVGGGGGGSSGINMLSAYNRDAESGITYWSETGGGTLTTTTTAANVGNGSASFSFDASAASDYAISDARAVPSGLYGANCLTEFYYKGFDANITAQVYDGTNVVASQVLVASTGFTKVQINFICPSSGNLQFKLLAGADAAIGYFDEVHLGSATNISNVSQASMYGMIRYAETANCTWGTGDTGGAMTVFTADTDCPAPTVAGNAAAPATKLPHVAFTNLPPGEYLVVATGYFGAEGTTTSIHEWGLSDGTTITGNVNFGVNSSTSTQGSTGTLSGRFVYTTAQSTLEFKVVASSSSNANDPRIFAGTGTSGPDFTITVYRFPTSSEAAVNTSAMAQSWSGYHDTTCSWARTNAAYGDPTDDATCALTERKNMNFGTVSTSGTVSPKIVFTPSSAGRYLVCTGATLQIATDTASGSIQLYDGTATLAETGIWASAANSAHRLYMCGMYVATSTSPVTLSMRIRSSSGAATITGGAGAGLADSAIEWNIVRIDRNANAPVLVGSVTSQSTGAVRVEYASINCDASSSITRQSGTWISAIGNVSSGACALTLAAGAFSSIPSCTITGDQNSSASAITWTALVSSATSVTAGCRYDLSGATPLNCTANDAHIICMGPR